MIPKIEVNFFFLFLSIFIYFFLLKNLEILTQNFHLIPSVCNSVSLLLTLYKIEKI